MPLVISLINLKGGVGKTTLTVALGEFMACQHELKVLIIDLDPQTNATVSLISEGEWKRRNVRGQTLLNMFSDQINKYKVFSAEEAIVRSVSNVGGGIEGLDLLPSSLDLIEFQDYVLEESGISAGSLNNLLGPAISDVLPGYDVVLIDCPPNLGFITQNGLLISDYYLIPVIPDILSTYGIPQILQRVKRLQKRYGIRIRPLGLVINKYRAQAPVHQSQLSILQTNAQRKGYSRVFTSVIPENNRSAGVMDVSTAFSSLKQKYDYNTPYKNYRDLCEEVLLYARK